MNKNTLIDIIKNNLQNDVSLEDISRELNHYICPLTRRNADIIEASIQADPKYPDVMSPIIKNLGIYQNNSSIPVITKALDKVHLEEFVWKVAIVNSIQGKKASVKTLISDYIINNGENFYERLRDGDLGLVEDMEAYVYLRGGCVRHECSWCSKVCKFLHDYLFNKDMYYIYDNNVRNKLNDYRRYYNLKVTNKSSIDVRYNEHWYKNLCASLERLREESGNNLARFEIDHILWGFAKYKVELARV